MGVSLDVYKYNYNELRNNLLDFLNLKRKENILELDNILSKFGNRIGDSYIIFNNELWEDFNPYWLLSHAIDLIYKVNDSFSVVIDTNRKTLINGVDFNDFLYEYYLEKREITNE